MVVTTMNRHLLVQLQTGTNAAGKPKLQNRAYPHVDVAASDDAIAGVLTALEPLFTDAVYAMGRVDTVQIQPDTTSSTSSGSASSGSGSSSGDASGATASGSGSTSGATASSATSSSTVTSSTSGSTSSSA